MNAIRTMLTGPDNMSYDVSRVSHILMTLAFIGLSAWDISQGHSFDPLTWAAGAGVLLSGGALGVRAKAATEPKA